MKEVSAGIILRLGEYGILMVHPTLNKKSLGFWDIPKGKIENGETPIDAAKREFKEETGLTLDNDTEYYDLGIIPYKKDKDLYLFMVDIENCNEHKANYYLSSAYCNHTFDYKGKKIPENNDFLITNNLQYLFPRMEISVKMAFDKYYRIKEVV